MGSGRGRDARYCVEEINGIKCNKIKTKRRNRIIGECHWDFRARRIGGGGVMLSVTVSCLIALRYV